MFILSLRCWVFMRSTCPGAGTSVLTSILSGLTVPTQSIGKEVTGMNLLYMFVMNGSPHSSRLSLKHRRMGKPLHFEKQLDSHDNC